MFTKNRFLFVTHRWFYLLHFTVIVKQVYVNFTVIVKRSVVLIFVVCARTTMSPQFYLAELRRHANTRYSVRLCFSVQHIMNLQYVFFMICV
jgi:hypothetical protein